MKIFCIGIGGIGLSGVAQILKHQGHDVAGSDKNESEITQKLSSSGIDVFHEHSAKNINEDIDLLIYSEAVPTENPERKKAKELSIKQINYATALGMISKEKKTIAITGTHGKTTVTGMLTTVLLETELDPSIIIGSKIDVLDHQNFHVGNGEWFLTEACEYRENFLELEPTIVLINNLEPDHLDYFQTAENYYSAYQKLIEKVPEEGHVIIFEPDQEKLEFSKVKGSVHIVSEQSCRKVIYDLKVPGKHNQRNAHAAEQVARVLDVHPDVIRKGLEDFNGTWRRFEYKGSINGSKVYDDYGHHPTEIQATLEGARQFFPDNNLVVVFQPHQYSRTAVFLKEFSTAFAGASEVWITPIYKVRDSEEDVEKVKTEDLVREVNKHQKAELLSEQEVVNRINSKATPYDVYLVMGAGNINKIFSDLKLEQ